MAAQRASGALFGMAFGDALGAPVEFMNVNMIREAFPPNGPQTIIGSPALVTDDTQMALAVGRALLRVTPPYTRANIYTPLRDEFIGWMDSPDNNRAPGNTCMDACASLEEGKPWYDATIPGSKGCGANMRVQPVGVLPAALIDDQTRAALAQFQAAMTHGHPTALAAADLTSAAIAYLIADGSPAALPAYLRNYAQSQRTIWYTGWIDPLWQRVSGYYASPQDYIARGWDECLGNLDRLDAALTADDRQSDPCAATGQGWIAEEALGTALLCFLMYPDDPLAAIRRAALTSGDSDSIACIAGALAGARHGLAAWPADWIARIEYHDQLAAMGAAWGR